MTLENGASSELNLFVWKGSIFNQKVSQVGEWGKRALGGLGVSAEHPPKSLGTQGLPAGRGGLRLEEARWEAALLAAVAFLSHFSPLPAFNGQFCGKREYVFSHRCWVQTLCILVLSVYFQMRMAMNVFWAFLFFKSKVLKILEMGYVWVRCASNSSKVVGHSLGITAVETPWSRGGACTPLLVLLLLMSRQIFRELR